MKDSPSDHNQNDNGVEAAYGKWREGLGNVAEAAVAEVEVASETAIETAAEDAFEDFAGVDDYLTSFSEERAEDAFEEFAKIEAYIDNLRDLTAAEIELDLYGIEEPVDKGWSYAAEDAFEEFAKIEAYLGDASDKLIDKAKTEQANIVAKVWETLTGGFGVIGEAIALAFSLLPVLLADLFEIPGNILFGLFRDFFFEETE